MLPMISVSILMLGLLKHGSKDFPIIVVFGRPGAGKSTVANKALEFLEANPHFVPIGLDLDVCVPQWMKDNFAIGKYPTLSERQQFAIEACDYVEQSITDFINEQAASGKRASAALVSFSFVNTDIREIFRKRFPWARWILVDTSETEAQQRIDSRTGHFYKGKNNRKTIEITVNEGDEDWAFAPVTFSHVCLNGMEPVDKNAEVIVQILKQLEA